MEIEMSAGAYSRVVAMFDLAFSLFEMANQAREAGDKCVWFETTAYTDEEKTKKVAENFRVLRLGNYSVTLDDFRLLHSAISDVTSSRMQGKCLNIRMNEQKSKIILAFEPCSQQEAPRRSLGPNHHRSKM